MKSHWTCLAFEIAWCGKAFAWCSSFVFYPVELTELFRQSSEPGASGKHWRVKLFSQLLKPHYIPKKIRFFYITFWRKKNRSSTNSSLKSISLMKMCSLSRCFALVTTAIDNVLLSFQKEKCQSFNEMTSRYFQFSLSNKFSVAVEFVLIVCSHNQSKHQ